MYVPKHTEQLSLSAMHGLIREYPLASLITCSDGGPEANHIPLHLNDTPGPYGCLTGHVARANPLLKDLPCALDSLAIFHGPNTYVSPSWYASKAHSGREVPTWNYIVVHAYGQLRVIDDREWLRSQLEILTHDHESPLSHPWSLSDAPRDYIEKMMNAIVGIELVIARLLGKWKISRNQTQENQHSVMAALRASGQHAALEIAKLMERPSSE